MTASATRPPWLCREHELEAFIEEHNPSLNLSALRRSRNDCQLVGVLLAQIVSKKNITPPCDWEMNLARIHLAVDLQNILKRWCVIGLQKTLDGSALGILFASEDGAGVGAAEQDVVVEVSPKVEVAASPQTLFSPAIPHGFLPDAETGWPYTKHKIMAVQPLKRPLEDVSHYNGSAKMARLEDGDHSEEIVKVARTEFQCPYYTQNPLTHPECSDKTFPNPRKLKEHVWRFIKPFKCETCGGGFGREKTRAIHSQDRKTKCIPAPSTYENSPDQRRDQRIGAAKSTQEMIRIFQDYELEKVSSRSHDADSVPADSLQEYRGSPSSESDSSDSLDDGSDGGLDSTAREYMPEACPIPTHNNTYYQQQQQKPDDYSRPRRQVSLTPDTYIRQFEHSLAPEPFHRGESAPPNFSTSTNEFAQPDLPTIIITKPESQQIAMLNQLQWRPQFPVASYQVEEEMPYQGEEMPYQGEEMPYQGEEMSYQGEEAPTVWPGSREGSRDAQGHTGSFHSVGYGSCTGFHYNLRNLQ